MTDVIVGLVVAVPMAAVVGWYLAGLLDPWLRRSVR